MNKQCGLTTYNSGIFFDQICIGNRPHNKGRTYEISINAKCS